MHLATSVNDEANTEDVTANKGKNLDPGELLNQAAVKLSVMEILVLKFSNLLMVK